MTDFLLGGPMGSAGTLRWGGSIEGVILAALLGVLAVGLAAYSGRHDRTLKGQVLELVGWTTAVLVLIISLAEPVWVEASGREEPGRFVVLVDGSRSMGVREMTGSRGRQAQSILEDMPTGADVYTFGDDLQVGAPDDWTLGGSDLGAA